MVERKTPQHSNEFLFDTFDPFEEKRKREKAIADKKKKRRRKIVKRVLIALISIVIIMSIYLFNDISKVKSITIQGNTYLTKKEIIELTGLDYQSRYILVFSPLVKLQLERNPFIDQAKVTHQANGIINITIKEEKVFGYIFKENKYQVILADGKKIEVEADNNIISKIPYIRDFNSESKLKKLVEALSSVSINTIETISEIWNYQTTYDHNMIRFVMCDGNQMFASLDSVYLIENYFEIMKSITKKNVCIILDSSTNTGYTRKCSEIEQEEIDLTQQKSDAMALLIKKMYQMQGKGD